MELEAERAIGQWHDEGGGEGMSVRDEDVDEMSDQEYVSRLRKSEEEYRFNVRIACQNLADIAGRYAAKAESLSRESVEGEGYTSAFHEFAEIRKLLSQAENSFNKTVRQHEAALLSLKEALRG